MPPPPGAMIDDDQASDVPLAIFVGRHRVAVSRGFADRLLRYLLRLCLEEQIRTEVQLDARG